jgi:Holliday junction resolvase RusA-like endonuclease
MEQTQWPACSLNDTDSSGYVIVLDHPLFSKARPRMTRYGAAYMPPAYKEAQRSIRKLIISQWGREPLSGPIGLNVKVYGEGRGDLDNIIGALMDAANSILWLDDRVSVIKSLSIEWEKAPRAQSRWVVQIIDRSI